ncbi:ATP-dependent DNA helicase RecG [bioreactor metagenome]|uniref:ATP-dependent DNA helicase RecG n=1 Tax=bioreactor metagenome TaxID=1076179 RepID=A0A645ABG3_9ZZZZ
MGSGKTIVAAAAAQQVLLAGHSVCLLAPTKILAQQHFHNLQNLFPELNFQLVTAQQRYQKTARPCFFIGTHGLLNHLEEIQPAFVIYDEQQRFGVKHRSLENYFSKNQAWPHLLSMTATPIPRTFMLSIFSHLDASYLQEMPKNRQMATTWLIPEKKAPAAWEWLADQLLLVDQQRIKQAIVVCPFIDPSKQQSLENVAAAESRFKELQHFFNEYYQKKGLSKQQQPTFGLLHARLSRKQQEQTIQEVYQQKIQILVSTPMVEVGVDLPNADFMVIEAAERFGLASLHQLRGRVGRAGQESFCLLLPSSTNVEQKETQKIRLQRLQHFCEEKDGLKLAELDLENRGAGNIFGMQQSGFQQLRFASWTNKNLIAQAQQLAQDSSLDENTLPLRSIFQIDPSELPIAAN